MGTGPQSNTVEGWDRQFSSTRAWRELAGLYLSVAAQQAWSHRDTGYAQTCRRLWDSQEPRTIQQHSSGPPRPGVLQAGGDAACVAEALTLARKAVQVGRGHGYFPYFQMALGMCEFRNGHWAKSDAVLLAAMKTHADASQLWLTSAFYRAMTLFRQGKPEEARNWQPKPRRK